MTQHKKEVVYPLLSILFLLGIVLIGINLLGKFYSIRNPSIYHLGNGRDIILTYQEALIQIQKLPVENNRDYVYRLTHVINQAIAHYWDDSGIDTFHMRIPIWDNYILWLSSYIYPHTFLRYEFTDYQRALERGIGLCSQEAIIEEEVLEKNGIHAKIIGLNGHVVTTAYIDGKWIISDPDFDTVIPNSIEEIENDPSIVIPYYKAIVDPNSLVKMYGTPQDNKVYESGQEYSHYKGLFEQAAYTGIWVFPIALMLPLLVSYGYYRKASNK